MMNNPYKLTFTLKQHTPIIHFQHDQAGATLRATEVKPKLDRFLINKLDLTTTVNDKEQPKTEFKSWFINNGEQHLALDYKLRISSTIKEKYYFTSNPQSNRHDTNRANTVLQEFEAIYVGETQYFANNENLKPDRINNSADVKLGIHCDKIDCAIQCFQPELLAEIKNHLIGFFLYENFGCRQSKGFGCYTVTSIASEDVQFNTVNLANQFQVVYRLDEQFNNITDAIKKVASVYKLLKSGRGQRERGGYKKSLLFRYFVSLPNPIRWEKRKIKQEIRSNYFKHRMNNGRFQDIELTYTNDPCYDLSNGQNWNDSPASYNYRYIRALLGLAESFEFLANDVENNSYKYYIQVKSNNDIERFKSPITVKVIDGYIFFCANAVNPKMLSTPKRQLTFNFDKRVKKNNRLQTNRYFEQNDFIKNLPTPSEFNIGQFMDFAFNTDAEKIDRVSVLKNDLI